jgi:formylmethanofuran dehydrogenase subunit E
MPDLQAFLNQTADLHSHLCPRQVLGVRMGILAGELLGIDLPRMDKRLLGIAETDGCTVDGISVATGCRVGRRTLRIEDYGKVAATFVDTQSGIARRVVARPDSRQFAQKYSNGQQDLWKVQLSAYQHMPADELFKVQNVSLRVPLERLISRPGKLTLCQHCGEEIMNEREMIIEGRTLCRACAGENYYVVHALTPVIFER